MAGAVRYLLSLGTKGLASGVLGRGLNYPGVGVLVKDGFKSHAWGWGCNSAVCNILSLIPDYSSPPKSHAYNPSTL